MHIKGLTGGAATLAIQTKLAGLAKSLWGKSFLSDFILKTNDSQMKTSIGQIQRSKELVDLSSNTMYNVDLIENLANNIRNLRRLDEQAGAAIPATLAAQKTQLEATQAQLKGTRGSLDALQKYSEGVNLLCNQSSVGIAPVIGADYKAGRFNFAAKYEFKTQIRMKNESTVFEASEIAAVNKFRDSEEVNEDAPAQLALGAQWAPVDQVRVNVGWHHFFDKDAEWYNNAQDLLDHDSNEYLAGVEWDINDRLTISGGMQLTRYGLSDQYMNDMSFVVNSYSLGLGFNYKANDKLVLKAGYFQTNYDHYKRENYPAEGFSDDFTRTNRVLGVGCEINL